MGWREHAEAGRLKDAFHAYVVEQDFVSFPEIQRQLAPFMPVEGTDAVTLADMPNAVLWVGMSPQFVTILQELLAEHRVQFAPSTPFVYAIDGGMLQFPVARRMPRGGDFKDPHWVVATIRPRRPSDTVSP